MNARIGRMCQALAVDDVPGETNIQLVVVVEVGKLFAVVKEGRESVIPPRQRTTSTPSFLSCRTSCPRK